MNDENNYNEDPGIEAWIDPAWETRIVALLQGEASDFETEDLENQMRENPELRVFHRRMLAVHGLLEAAVGDGGKAEGANVDEWRLSPERREAVLARLREKVEAPVEVAEKKGPKAMNLVKVECPKAAELRRRKAWTWAISSAAALFISLFMMAGLLFRRFEVKSSAPMDVAFGAESESMFKDRAGDYATEKLDKKEYTQSVKAKPLAPSAVTGPSTSRNPKPANVLASAQTESVTVPSLDVPSTTRPSLGETSFGEGFAEDGAKVAANFESHFSDEVTRYAIPDKMEDLPISDQFYAEADKAAQSADEDVEVAQADANRYFRKEGQSADGEDWVRERGLERDEPREQAPTIEEPARPEIVKGDKGRSRSAAEADSREKEERFGWASQQGAITSLGTKVEDEQVEANLFGRFKESRGEIRDAESADRTWVDLNEGGASGELKLPALIADPLAQGIPADVATEGRELESKAKLGDRLERLPSSRATLEDDGLDVEGKDSGEIASRKTATRGSLEEGPTYREMGDLDKAGKRSEDASRREGEKDEALKDVDDQAVVRLAAQVATGDQTRGKKLQEVDQLWEEKGAPTEAPVDAAPEMTVTAGKKVADDDFGLVAPQSEAGLGAVQGGPARGPVSNLALAEDAIADGRVDEELREEMPLVLSGGGGFGGGGVAGGNAVPGQSLAMTPEVAAKSGEAWGGVRSGQQAFQNQAIDGLLTDLPDESLVTELAEQVAGNGQAQQQQGQTNLATYSRESVIAGEEARSGGEEVTKVPLDTAPEVVEYEGFVNGGIPIVEREFLGGATNLREFDFREVAPTAEPQAAAASEIAPDGTVAIAGTAMPEGEVALGFDVEVGHDSTYLFRGLDVVDGDSHRVFSSGGTTVPGSSDPTNWAFVRPDVGGTELLSGSTVARGGTGDFYYATEHDSPEIPQELGSVAGGIVTAFPVTPSNPTSFEEVGKASGTEFGNRGTDTLDVELARQKEKADAARVAMLDVMENNDISDISGDMPVWMGSSVQTGSGDLVRTSEVDIYEERKSIAALQAHTSILKDLEGDDLIKGASSLGLNDSVIQKMLPEYQELQNERAQLAAEGITAEHPKIKELETRISGTREKLVDASQTVRKSLETSLTMAEKSVASVEAARRKTLAEDMDEKRRSIDYIQAKNAYKLESEKLAIMQEQLFKERLEAKLGDIGDNVDALSSSLRDLNIFQEAGSVAGGRVTAFPVTPANPTSLEANEEAPANVDFAKDFLAGEQLAVRGEATGRDLGNWKANIAADGKELAKLQEVEELTSLEKKLDEAEPAKPSEPAAESKPAAEPEPAPIEEPVAPIEAQPEIETSVEPASTFSLHVSDVSFKLAEASLLEKGEWPAAGKVRVEEFVNAFDYGDPAPTQDEAVACRTEQAAHPFLPQRNLLRVAMRTGATGRASSQPLRLTVLLDKSGSMERADREASVQRAMEALASHLSANDSVTLIGFARQPRLIADRLSGERANELAGMVERAPSEGGTNLEEALNLAAAKAKEQFVEGGQNRIVLLTDGAANLGNARPESLAERVVALRQQGIAFDACGVGADGLNDAILEALTRKGDGRYYFLNRPADADEGFVRQLAGALRPAAKNVKVQVIFNPERVTRYRLLGFEKHMLKKEDFRNDTVDAAEMAAAEAGVGLYEMEVNAAGQGDVGEVFVRFQDMATGEMVERSWTIPYDAGTPSLDESTPSMQLAGTAAFLGMKLRGGPDAGMVRFEDLGTVTSGLRTKFAGNARVGRLVQMVEKVRE